VTFVLGKKQRTFLSSTESTMQKPEEVVTEGEQFQSEPPQAKEAEKKNTACGKRSAVNLGAKGKTSNLWGTKVGNAKAQVSKGGTYLISKGQTRTRRVGTHPTAKPFGFDDRRAGCGVLRSEAGETNSIKHGPRRRVPQFFMLVLERIGGERVCI